MTSKKLKSDCREETEVGNWDELPQEVLNMIFNHLPVADLLACSVMSKSWKKASRDILKRSRECYAHIKNIPQDVQALNDIIASQGPMQMFNGLHIKIRPEDDNGRCDWQDEFSCSYAENMLKTKQTGQKLERAKRRLKAILCGQWKYLTLDMGHYWGQILSIGDALLLRELISATSESLQKLVVAWDLDCHFISSCGKKFTKLQVLVTQNNDAHTVGRGETWLEEFVLKLAPNLEEITGEMRRVEVHHPGNTFMLKRMKSILVAPDPVMPEAGLMEGFRYVSGLYRLSIKINHTSNPDDIRTLLSVVFKSSKTLEELYMYTSELYKLFKMSDEIHFPNLQRLSLATHCGMPFENEISILRRLNLTKLCPNLKHLELSLDRRYGLESYVEEEDIEFQEQGPYGVDKSDLPIQVVIHSRSDGLYHHEHLEFLSQIYPKMYKVKIVEGTLGCSPEMNSIFSDLHSFECLEINLSRFYRYSTYSPDVAIAAILCGINIEEAKFLFSGLSNTNADLNPLIVPIRPSLFNAKNLKELKITGGGYSGGNVSHRWIINVTENLPVRHVRELIITFESLGFLYDQLNDMPGLKKLLCAQVDEN